MTLIDKARELLSVGFSVLPVEEKRPLPGFEWKPFQERWMTEEEADRWFADARGIGVICGKVSGGLEVMDFDLKYDKAGNLWDLFCERMQAEAPQLWADLSCSVVLTKNKGRHLYYRLDSDESEKLDGNKVLAKNEDGSVLIETRGEGGYVVAPPSPGYTTPEGRKLDVSYITAGDRELLHRIAKEFHKGEIPQAAKSGGTSRPVIHGSYFGQLSPKDDYNARTSNVDLLQSFGWTVVNNDGIRTYLKRPGDSDSETSGNVLNSSGVFCCHSTSTVFPVGIGLTPYGVLTYLQFNGDEDKSASYLKSQGYGARSSTGSPVESKVTTFSDLDSMLEATRIHTALKIPESVPLLRVKGRIISTLGNVTTCMGKSKSGKTGLLWTLMAGLINPDGRDFDSLGMDITPSDGKLVLHIDTEQSRTDHQRGVGRMLKRLGLPPESEPGYFKSHNFMGTSIQESIQLLDFALKKYADQFGGVHAILLDGGADFVTSVNDEAECNQFALALQRMARDYNCVVFNVLHFNPNSVDKGRGHLGSALERKSESVLSITKDEAGVSRYEPFKGLLRNAGEFPPFQFVYSEFEGLHVSHGFEQTQMEKQEQKRSELIQELASIFESGGGGLAYKDLCEEAGALYGIDPASVKKKVPKWIKDKVLFKDASGIYRLNGGQVDEGGKST